MTSSPQSDVRALHAGILLGVLVLLAMVASALLAGNGRSAIQTQGLIAFTRSDGIYVMRSDGSGVRRIRRVAVSGRLAWSPDGSKLAFGDGLSIRVMKADGSHLVRLVRGSFSSGGLRNLGSPTWSPDGLKIAFTAHRDEAGPTWSRDIWVVRTDGMGLRRLARTSRTEYEISWSPNGGRIAFTDITGTVSRPYVMNADGSQPRTLTPPGTDFREALSPEWSPDGRTIAVVHRVSSASRVELRIWMADPRTREWRRVSSASSSHPHTYPTWSPDGRKIAFVRGDGKWADALNFPVPRRSSSEIYVMTADGTGMTRLTHNALGEGPPAWQPFDRP